MKSVRDSLKKSLEEFLMKSVRKSLRESPQRKRKGPAGRQGFSRLFCFLMEGPELSGAISVLILISKR